MSGSQDYDFAKYERIREPGQAARVSAWKAAIGLQKVDGLSPSEYLVAAAHRNIDGEISLNDVRNLVDDHYRRKNAPSDARDTMEADIVAVEIADIIGERTFALSSFELCGTHRRLFSKIFDHAGKFRKYNFTKGELVLDGDTISYAQFADLRPMLDLGFCLEKDFPLEGKSKIEIARHVEKLVSDIWQIHPFCEGNTRTAAVFAVRYLRKLGFAVSNDAFLKHSWFFRNALVRANYDNVELGVTRSMKPLDMFFDNLLFGARHELRNRELHIRWKPEERTAPGGGGRTPA